MKMSSTTSSLSVAFATATLMSAPPVMAQTRYEPPPMVKMAQAETNQGSHDQAQPMRPRQAPHQQAQAPDDSASPGRSPSRSQGVIDPPSTGDKSVVPPPHTGAQSMPVIPPPGTPGGNEQIRPK